jgi:uncharacterized protein YfaT (DUF1175 family)
MLPPSTSARLLLALVLLIATAAASPAQVRLADDSDRSAFRSWFTLLADAQFERPAAEVADCAALVRLAFREALRAHTPEWSRRAALPLAPRFPDVKSAPRATAAGWPLFRVSEAGPARFAEFADARTLIALNSVPVGRQSSRAMPGDLLYFRQPGGPQPDHLMVMIGRSFFEDEGADWVVYHTGPDDSGPGEVRKVRLSTLVQHPSSRWRPLASNPQFVGVFRLHALHTP